MCKKFLRNFKKNKVGQELTIMYNKNSHSVIMFKDTEEEIWKQAVMKRSLTD